MILNALVFIGYALCTLGVFLDQSVITDNGSKMTKGEILRISLIVSGVAIIIFCYMLGALSIGV